MATVPARKVQELPGAPPSHLKKRTMIKDLVGSVRTTSYELPEDLHIYGKPDIKDTEGSGVVMSQWVASVPSKPKESQRSFIKTNKCALKEGCITAKAQRTYAQEHQDIRFKQPSGKHSAHHFEPAFKGPYGAVTESQNESVRKLIEAGYTEWTDDAVDYPDLSSLEQKRRLKPPKATKASMGHDIRTNHPPPAKEPFKMKRFATVKARVQFPLTKAVAIKAADVDATGNTPETETEPDTKKEGTSEEPEIN
ncbi:hypothetical protein CTAYLR_000827 [Chrysophaeum taylorii]|uniref:Uncharacterized protein n=1 Tax=Chrysophaeum taylorii TaxID=2483200 RepID=A0AAD7XSA0_9STRA|nr:hypothetical protein CTAYLR_000827 [Chrysophaeum taylorii]